MTLEELRKKRENISARADRHLENMEMIAQESGRVAQVAGNAEIILDDIEQKFRRYTGLSETDIDFLFFAIALQVARQYLVTKFPKRLDDQTAAKNTAGHNEEHSERKHRYYQPSLEEIITNPVPFDANIGANGALSGGKQMGHRVTALGHDPLLGMIIGTANIATSTLTNNRLESYHIYTNSSGRDYFRNKADTGLVLIHTKDKLLHEGMEGKTIVGVSLLKEIIHLRSDLHTTNSLPLPVVSVINPSLAANLAKRGFDMSNAVSVGKQAVYAILINTLIFMLHTLLYDESLDINQKLYEVRTRKILSYSNFIASMSNLGITGMGILGGNVDAIRYLDVGGLLVTLHRIITDAQFIRKVKEEFIEQEFFAQIRGSEYDFINI